MWGHVIFGQPSSIYPVISPSALLCIYLKWEMKSEIGQLYAFRSMAVSASPCPQTQVLPLRQSANWPRRESVLRQTVFYLSHWMSGTVSKLIYYPILILAWKTFTCFIDLETVGYKIQGLRLQVSCITNQPHDKMIFSIFSRDKFVQENVPMQIKRLFSLMWKNK